MALTQPARVRKDLCGMKIPPLRTAIIVTLFSCGVFLPTLHADREASEEMRRSDTELNRTYQKALAAMPDADAKAALRESQRAWVAFRDAEMELLQHSGVGTGNTEKESHMTDVNNHRSKELQDLTEMTR